ncbi:MAG: hypothetical protein P1P89_13745 [Desulfobacterales bacterium]|nr:hypothetical protein [Desulfobacterales bacterium]
MKKIKDQLKKIAKSLTSLSVQVEKISKQMVALSPPKKSVVKKRATKKKAVKRVAAKKTVAKKPTAKTTVLDSVIAVIKRSKKGANIDTLRKKTGLGPRQLSNALYKLSKRGVIEAKARGIYTIK